MLKRNLFILTCLVGLSGCDQASKLLAENFLHGLGSVDVLGSFFQLVYTRNNGAFLGMGSAWPDWVRVGLFSVIVAVFLFGLLYYLLSRQLPHGLTIGWVLLLAGGLGNWFDRIIRDGGVVDFMLLDFGVYRTGIFNLADVFIMVGAVYVLFTQARSSAQA